MSSMSKLGRQIKDLRLGKGWSQTKMANFLGISRVTLIRLERAQDVQELTRAKVERRLAELQPQSAVA